MAGLGPQKNRCSYTRLGLSVRWTSNPNTEERDREEDDAWERLRRLGLDPKKYFPDEGLWG